MYLVPVTYLLFGGMPAEKDDAAIPLVREIQESYVEIFEENAELVDALDHQVEVIRLNPVLRAYPAAAVRDGGL
jgi:hypothetical protein